MIRFLISILFILISAILPLSGQSLNSVSLCNLTDEISETSGLLWINDSLWTHNDSGDVAKLYCIDTNTGNVLAEKQIANAINKDWEAICMDNEHIYIGDFGNNSGNRTDLKIYKLDKSEFSKGNQLTAETINFYYPNQANFNWENHSHNYDCEAMIALEDSIYLFSKNWENEKTYLYALPAQSGNHVAVLKDSLDVGALITDAAYNAETGSILLLAYTSNLSTSYLYLLKNYPNQDFFDGIQIQINLSLLLHQTEGITFFNKDKILFSNETFLSVNAKLKRADLNDLNNIITEATNKTNPTFYPNPAKYLIKFSGCARFDQFTIYDIKGTPVYEKSIKDDNFIVQVMCFKPGLYHIEYKSKNERFSDVLIINM